MSRKSAFCLFVFFIALVFALPLTAVAREKSLKMDMDLDQPTSVDGHELKAGDYQVSATDATVVFKHNGKEVISVPAKWQDAPAKSSDDSIQTSTGKLEEIHFHGKTRFLEFD